MLFIVLPFLIMGGIFAFLKKQTPDLLANLSPYVDSSHTIYIDPTLNAKTIPGMPTLPASTMQPEVFRSLKLKNISFQQISDILHHDLKAKDGWTFAPSPMRGSHFHILQAVKKTTTGGIGPNQHSIIVFYEDPSSFPNISTREPMMRIMETRNLASWEVYWLKLKNVGHDPFKSVDDAVNASSIP